jgi:hypothetical protein
MKITRVRSRFMRRWARDYKGLAAKAALLGIAFLLGMIAA